MERLSQELLFGRLLVREDIQDIGQEKHRKQKSTGPAQGGGVGWGATASNTCSHTVLQTCPLH